MRDGSSWKKQYATRGGGAKLPVSRTRCGILHAAPQSRDRTKHRAMYGPGSAAHRFARATRCAASGARTSPPAQRRHDDFVAAAGAAGDFLAGAELQILVHADADLAQAALVADHRDGGIAQAGIGLDEGILHRVR